MYTDFAPVCKLKEQDYVRPQGSETAHKGRKILGLASQGGNKSCELSGNTHVRTNSLGKWTCVLLIVSVEIARNKWEHYSYDQGNISKIPLN